MLDKVINILLKFSLFYDLEQTRRAILKEFYAELNKSSQDPITVRTYEDLNETDKTIVKQFAKNFRKFNNSVYLAQKLNYSERYIFKRLVFITDLIKYNIIKSKETVQFNEV